MSAASWTLAVGVVELPLAERFTIARESWDVAANVFVAVSFDGITGVGESSPDAHWGESTDSVVAQLGAVDLGAVAGPFDLETVGELLPPGAARAALDIALHDLAAKRAGISVAELLGVGNRRLPRTSVTVPISDRDTTVARARRLADHPVLKMKVGFDRDVDAVRAVRDVFDGTLRIDANEGWDVATAVARLRMLTSLDIELCEQPIPSGDRDGLRRVTDSSPIAIYADEDACTATDVARLAGAVHGVNLKLRKAGGVRETCRAITVARALDLGVMLGCDLESGVAATAEASVAALVDKADLDGPLLLEEDPFPGVSYSRGEMTLPRGPGLGLSREPVL